MPGAGQQEQHPGALLSHSRIQISVLTAGWPLVWFNQALHSMQPAHRCWDASPGLCQAWCKPAGIGGLGMESKKIHFFSHMRDRYLLETELQHATRQRSCSTGLSQTWNLRVSWDREQEKSSPEDMGGEGAGCGTLFLAMTNTAFKISASHSTWKRKKKIIFINNPKYSTSLTTVTLWLTLWL